MKLSVSAPIYSSGFISEEARYHVIAAAGFRFINCDFPNFNKENPTAMDYMCDEWRTVARQHRELLNRAGLTPIMAHGPYCYPVTPDNRDAYIAACTRVIESCAEIGIPHVVFHPDAAPGMSQDAFLSTNRALFRSLIPALEKTGVVALLENIGQASDPHHLHNGSELRQTIEAVDHPLFAACWDAGHDNHNEADQRESLRTLGSLIKGLHIHDNLGDIAVHEKFPLNDMHLLPLFGTVDYDTVISTLKEIGYSGYFNFEVKTPHSSHGKLAAVMPEIYRHTLTMLYGVGQCMLEAYDWFEA